MLHSTSVIDMDKAERQHQSYIEALRSLGLQVHILPSKGYPDSVFIEDTMVAINNTVLITNPGAASRRGEIMAVKDFLLVRSDFRKKYRICELEGGTVDGGDVLFTGDVIFVGKTLRTNSLGIESLRKCFGAQYPVHAVDMSQLARETSSISNQSMNKMPPLHLKSICSMLSPGHVILGGVYAKSLQSLMTQATNSLKYTIVPDEGAANCLYINGTVIRRCDWEYPASSPIFATLPSAIPQIQVANSELEKVDGALTCCSVLFQ